MSRRGAAEPRSRPPPRNNYRDEWEGAYDRSGRDFRGTPPYARQDDSVSSYASRFDGRPRDSGSAGGRWDDSDGGRGSYPYPDYDDHGQYNDSRQYARPRPASRYDQRDSYYSAAPPPVPNYGPSPAPPASYYQDPNAQIQPLYATPSPLFQNPVAYSPVPISGGVSAPYGQTQPYSVSGPAVPSGTSLQLPPSQGYAQTTLDPARAPSPAPPVVYANLAPQLQQSPYLYSTPAPPAQQPQPPVSVLPPPQTAVQYLVQPSASAPPQSVYVASPQQTQQWATAPVQPPPVDQGLTPSYTGYIASAAAPPQPQYQQPRYQQQLSLQPQYTPATSQQQYVVYTSPPTVPSSPQPPPPSQLPPQSQYYTTNNTLSPPAPSAPSTLLSQPLNTSLPQPNLPVSAPPPSFSGSTAYANPAPVYPSSQPGSNSAQLQSTPGHWVWQNTNSTPPSNPPPPTQLPPPAVSTSTATPPDTPSDDDKSPGPIPISSTATTPAPSTVASTITSSKKAVAYQSTAPPPTTSKISPLPLVDPPSEVNQPLSNDPSANDSGEESPLPPKSKTKSKSKPSPDDYYDDSPPKSSKFKKVVDPPSDDDPPPRSSKSKKVVDPPSDENPDPPKKSRSLKKSYQDDQGDQTDQDDGGDDGERKSRSSKRDKKDKKSKKVYSDNDGSGTDDNSSRKKRHHHHQEPPRRRGRSATIDDHDDSYNRGYQQGDPAYYDDREQYHEPSHDDSPQDYAQADKPKKKKGLGGWLDRRLNQAASAVVPSAPAPEVYYSPAKPERPQQEFRAQSLPKIAPAKMERIAQWSADVASPPLPDTHTRSVSFSGATPYQSQVPSAPPPIKSAMKSSSKLAYQSLAKKPLPVRHEPRQEEMSLDDVIDPFLPATSGNAAGQLYGNWN